MLNVGEFSIVSSADVTAPEGESIESDCRHEGSGWQSEQDCACPAVDLPFQPEQVRPEQARPYTVPPLYREWLDDDSCLAFNPTGHAGVVLFNQPVSQLLGAFQQPRLLEEGIGLAGSSTYGLEAALRLVQMDLLRPDGESVQIRLAAPHTLTAWLHVTNDCNLRCPYCYVNKTPDRMEVERGRGAVEAVFRSAERRGFEAVKLKFAGGEASLNFPLVLSLFDHARSLAQAAGLGLDGVVLSNGVSLTRRMIGALQARGLRLMISLDGVGAVHDRQRPFANGRGSFRFVERSLNFLEQEGLIPSISVTVSNRNLGSLPETVAYLLDRGLPFSLNYYRENDCSAGLNDLTFQDEAVIAAHRAAFAVIRERLPSYSLLGVLLDRARLDAPHDRPCGAGQSYLVIDQVGGVASCPMTLGETFTNVSDADPLGTLMESRQGIQNLPVDEKEGCRDCSWRYWCAGGCPALTYRVTGRFDVKSPNCRIYRALFPEVLRLEGLRLMKYGRVH